MTTTNADTHPCLAERLRALGCSPADCLVPAAITGGGLAADVLLGQSVNEVRTDIEQAWRQRCESVWRDRHAKSGALKDRLSALPTVAETSARDVESLWDKARLTLDLEGEKAAMPLLHEVLDLRPAHAAANFFLGRGLLNDGQAAGEALIERAMAEDENLVPQGCEVLHGYFRRTGRSERLREVTARLDRHEAALAASHRERSSVSADDTFIPHGLGGAELAALRQVLSAEPDLAGAALARKELRHFARQKLFVLGLRVRPRWHHLPDHDREQALIGRLTHSVCLPGRVFIFPASGEWRALARKVGTVPGAAVFPGV